MNKKTTTSAPLARFRAAGFAALALLGGAGLPLRALPWDPEIILGCGPDEDLVRTGDFPRRKNMDRVMFLNNADLRDADFGGKTLRGAELCGTDCTGASFTGVDLRTTTMNGTRFGGNDFKGAILTARQAEQLQAGGVDVSEAVVDDAPDPARTEDGLSLTLPWPELDTDSSGGALGLGGFGAGGSATFAGAGGAAEGPQGGWPPLPPPSLRPAALGDSDPARAALGRRSPAPRNTHGSLAAPASGAGPQDLQDLQASRPEVPPRGPGVGLVPASAHGFRPITPETTAPGPRPGPQVSFPTPLRPSPSSPPSPLPARVPVVPVGPVIPPPGAVPTSHAPAGPAFSRLPAMQASPVQPSPRPSPWQASPAAPPLRSPLPLGGGASASASSRSGSASSMAAAPAPLAQPVPAGGSKVIWWQGFHALKSFAETNGHLRVDDEFWVGDDLHLASWMKSLRSKLTRLGQDQALALGTIPGLRDWLEQPDAPAPAAGAGGPGGGVPPVAAAPGSAPAQAPAPGSVPALGPDTMLGLLPGRNWLRARDLAGRRDLDGLVALPKANLKNVDFTGKTLAKANLGNADCSGARFCGVDLRETNLASATLTGADFQGAILQPAAALELLGRNVDLRGARFLERGAALEPPSATGSAVATARGPDPSAESRAAKRQRKE